MFTSTKRFLWSSPSEIKRIIQREYSIPFYQACPSFLKTTTQIIFLKQIRCPIPFLLSVTVSRLWSLYESNFTSTHALAIRVMKQTGHGWRHRQVRDVMGSVRPHDCFHCGLEQMSFITPCASARVKQKPSRFLEPHVIRRTTRNKQYDTRQERSWSDNIDSQLRDCLKNSATPQTGVTEADSNQ